MRNVPFSVWRLMLAYALMMAGTSMMVLLAGIIGTRFAPSAGLATLPIAMAVVGVAAATLPTGRLMHVFGRRKVFLGYAMLAIAAALLAAASLVAGSFAGCCLAGFLIGWSGAAGHQYRFAALEMVPAEIAPKATSALLLGGILGAFIGPEMAVRGRFLLDTDYAGSYLLLAWGYVLGLLIVTRYSESRHAGQQAATGGRPLAQVLRQPVVTLAVASAAIAYGLMSFLMTATPISMHEHAGHSLEATKWVIQTHIAAMYLPALVFPLLLARFGYRSLLWAGVVAYFVTIWVAISGTQLVNYWVSMLVLGVGWNFLFLSSTNLLPQGYLPEERFRVQSFNDFLTFTVQAVVSLSSGWFLFRFQWTGLLGTGAALLLAYALLLWRSAAFQGRVLPTGWPGRRAATQRIMNEVDFHE